MKIRQWVEFADEIDVEIDQETLIQAFRTFPEPGQTWLQLLNTFALALNALPDETIATFTPKQRKSIGDFLSKHASRFCVSDTLNR